ncbi:hypothetical protein K431DRAFT_226618, partial [Polychaeton citri CBS 116435]
SNQRPYLSHVLAVSEAWPHVRYLADWMEVTTAPVKWNLIRDNESVVRSERASRTKVAAVDFSSKAGVTIDRISRSTDLATALQDHSSQQSTDAHRLYIVEDLSRDVIELLGNALDIDPLFFREQISDYIWYNTRDPWVELPDLRVVQSERRFFRIKYLQPRYFKNPASFERATTEAASFNILRRLDNDKNHKTVLDNEGATVALVRSRASFWWRPAVQGKHGAITISYDLGVLLIDPTLGEGFPLWGGNRNFMQTPSLSEKGPFDKLPRSSLFDRLLYWCKQTSQADIQEMAQDPRVMSFRMSQIICAEWLTVCQYVTARLAQIDWELQNPDFRKDPSGIDSSLSKLHPWRRNVPVFKTMLDESARRVFAETPDPVCPRMKSLQQDFQGAGEAINDLQNRIERIVGVATAIISIEESRRAIGLNTYLGRLTYLAVIFAPLSFVSSFFSMSSDVTQLSETFWIYFVVAIPVSTLAFFIVDQARFVRGFEKLKSCIKRKKK